MDTVTGTLSSVVETNDPLVRRGAQLFFAEMFAGNGRTCGTCHRIDDNLTISPSFIAGLPQSDPLFVFETNPALAQLENGPMLRQRALFVENVDGFDDTTPPLRSANHTFALGTTNDFVSGLFGNYPANPPRHRLGWGGDGAPGGGSLHEFAFGAIIQHLTKTMNRVPGTDFRIPTQQELDALEAFQLFTGRQKIPNTAVIAFRDTTAQRGQGLTLSMTTGGKCAACHFELQNGPVNNENFNIGTQLRVSDLPADDGFRTPRIDETFPAFVPNTGVPGKGLMNVPPVIEAADTGPFFHNNSAQTIEDVVEHYRSALFNTSPAAVNVLQGTIVLTNTEAADIANFLREVNAAENIRQVRKRARFVHDNRSSGNTTLLTVAIRDTQDAIDDLAAKNLNLAARNNLATVKQALIQAKAQPDADRPAYIDTALVYLELAKNAILTADPDGDF
jgi:hypothetical protein